MRGPVKAKKIEMMRKAIASPDDERIVKMQV